MKKDQIILNSIITPDGTVMVSRDTWDYQTYTDANGLVYMVDGGTSYLRRNTHTEHPHTEASVFMSDDHEKRRKAFTWGTFGKTGREPFRRVALADMTDNHIAAILDTQEHIKGTYVEELMKAEQEWREAP